MDRDDWTEEDREDEQRLMDLHEFDLDFGSHKKEFVKRWKQMFGKPPSNEVQGQWEDAHNRLVFRARLLV